MGSDVSIVARNEDRLAAAVEKMEARSVPRGDS